MRELFLSGFADEAAETLAGQINVIKTLGWKYLEARKIEGFHIHDLDEKAFDRVYAALEEANIRINCIGSSIANWGTPVDTDIAATMAAVERTIKQMRRLNVKMVRLMSYAILFDNNKRPLPDQKEEKRFGQLRKICGAFLDAGITPAHENYCNYGSMSWEHTLKMLDAVPGLKLVYDTSDTGLSPDYRKPYPYPPQDCLEAWDKLKTHVVHIHIKDGCLDPETGREVFLYPGQGDCEVKKILDDAISMGYSGFFTIEPHMAAVIHNASVKTSSGYSSDSFVKYGKLTEELFRGLGCKVHDGAVYPDN